LRIDSTLVTATGDANSQAAGIARTTNRGLKL
jgi:hypothetical protein